MPQFLLHLVLQDLQCLFLQDLQCLFFIGVTA
jgi:hypothetical protein